MLRQLPCVALAASLTAAGCFSDAPVGTAGGPGSTGGSATTSEAGTGGSGGITATGTDPSDSGTTSSGSDSGGTTEGTDTGLETTGSGSGSDSGSDSGRPLPTVCPTFFDAFDDETEDPLWRQSFGASTTEVGGELVIAVTGEQNDQYVTMVVLPEDGGLAEGTMRVELGTTPVEVGVRTTLWVQPLSNDGRISYNLVDRGSGLRLEARITPEVGSPQVLDALDWEAATMNWLQLREAQGMLYFETSSDGVTFETFYEMTTPFDVSSAEVGFAGHNDLPLPVDVEVSVRTFEFICG